MPEPAWRCTATSAPARLRAPKPALAPIMHRATCAGQRRARARAVLPIDARDLLGRDHILRPVAPGEHDECRVGADAGPQRPSTRCARSARSRRRWRRTRRRSRSALLRGISIASIVAARRAASCRAGALLRSPSRRPRPSTSGRTAKLNAGGGEAVAHSSDRPSQGSPVRSRSSLALADADDELRDLADDARSGSATAPTAATSSQGRHSGDVVVLHAPRHAHEAQRHRAA